MHANKRMHRNIAVCQCEEWDSYRALMILIGEKNWPSKADYDLNNSGRSKVEQVEDWSKRFKKWQANHHIVH